MFGLFPLVVIVALICGGFYFLVRRKGLATEQAELAQGPRASRTNSLLTDALAYIGAALVLAGGGVVLAQRWRDLTSWEHVSVFAGTAVFFLAIGLLMRRRADPAILQLIGVVWFISAALLATATGIATHAVYGKSGAVTALAVGIVVAAYSAVLWLARRRELEMVAMLGGLVIAVCGIILTIAGAGAVWLAVALGLWGLGVALAILGWQYPEQLWTIVPLGAALALIAPSFAVWGHSWVYAIAIATAAAAMAASVPMRNTVLLGAGTVALFGYVTSAVVRNVHESLGVPPTLAITGVILLLVAAGTARLRRATRRPEAERAAPAGPVHLGKAQAFAEAEQPSTAEQPIAAEEPTAAEADAAADEDAAAEEHGAAAEPRRPRLYLPKAS